MKNHHSDTFHIATPNQKKADYVFHFCFSFSRFIFQDLNILVNVKGR